jgi:hypothetical protein
MLCPNTTGGSSDSTAATAITSAAQLASEYFARRPLSP